MMTHMATFMIDGSHIVSHRFTGSYDAAIDHARRECAENGGRVWISAWADDDRDWYEIFSCKDVDGEILYR